MIVLFWGARTLEALSPSRMMILIVLSFSPAFPLKIVLRCFWSVALLTEGDPENFLLRVRCSAFGVVG